MALIAIASCRCSGKGPRAEGAMNLELRRLVKRFNTIAKDY